MRIKRKLFWIAMGGLALLIKWIGSYHPLWIEEYYSRRVFLPIRALFDIFFGWLPFPLIYVFIILLGIWLWKSLQQIGRHSPHWPTRLLHAGLGFTAFVSAVIFAFMFLWGFNYGRVSMEDQLGIDPQPLNKEEIWTALQAETEEVVALRAQIPSATAAALARSQLPPGLEKKLRQSLKTWLHENGFPAWSNARAHKIYPKGIFMRFSSSGLYFPFTGQGQVDAGLHPLQWPYVMTHEMGHAYGFGDEGTCNFLAYVACAASDDPVIAYMGRLAYWRTLATSYLRYEREAYQAFRADLPEGMQADLDAINDNLRAYPDIMPKVRYAAYDAYLKAQGIKEGMLNYSRVMMLVKAWKEKVVEEEKK